MTLTIEAPVQAPVKTVADVLEHAALIIEERGWTQDNFETRDGAVCAIGAIGLASEGNSHAYITDGHEREQAYLIAYLQHQVGDWPPNWNDEPGRTAAEVTAALRAAAKAAR